MTELVARYMEHASVYYRKPVGTPTHEVVNIRYTVRPLLELFATLQVSKFELRCLKTLREKMIDAGLARVTVSFRLPADLTRRWTSWRNR